jgi:hypothetical protein
MEIIYRVGEESKGDFSAKNQNSGIISYGNRVVAPIVVVMHPARHTPWQGAIP